MKDLPNTLGVEAGTKNWYRVQRPSSAVTHDSVEDFPEMIENYLKIFFTGKYRLGQSVSYLAHMLDHKDDAISENVWYHRKDTNILKMKVQSRHRSSKEWRCYIDYVPDSTDCAGIRRHCCGCSNGAHTVGCCSHVAAPVVYYLSHARYPSRIIRPAEFLTSLFKDRSLVPVIEEDSDDED